MCSKSSDIKNIFKEKEMRSKQNTSLSMEAPPRFELGNRGFADLNPVSIFVDISMFSDIGSGFVTLLSHYLFYNFAPILC